MVMMKRGGRRVKVRRALSKAKRHEKCSESGQEGKGPGMTEGWGGVGVWIGKGRRVKLFWKIVELFICKSLELK